MAEPKPFCRHGQKSREYMDSLRSITPEDYKQLEITCIQAIVSGCEHVIISFPYTAKFAKDWPKGRLIEKSGPTNFYKVKPDKVMKWLLKHGYTEVTMEMLRLQQIAYTKFEKELLDGIM